MAKFLYTLFLTKSSQIRRMHLTKTFHLQYVNRDVVPVILYIFQILSSPKCWQHLRSGQFRVFNVHIQSKLL